MTRSRKGRYRATHLYSTSMRTRQVSRECPFQSFAIGVRCCATSFTLDGHEKQNQNHDQSISYTYRSTVSAKSDIWPHKRISERASELTPPYNSSISSAITVAIMNRRRVRGRAAKRPSVRRTDDLHLIQNALFPSGLGKEGDLLPRSWRSLRMRTHTLYSNREHSEHDQ